MLRGAGAPAVASPPVTRVMRKIEVYSSDYCAFCWSLRRLLDEKGVDYTVISVDEHPEKRAEAIRRGGDGTVPQVFVDGQPAGGLDDIHILDLAGRLDPLLGLSPD